MRAWALLVAVAFSTSACATAPQRSTVMADSEGILVTEAELRALLYDFVFDFTQTVELAADAIANSEDADAERLRSALLWKIGAGSQAKRAAFNLDVAIGFMDAWSLAEQQKQFFQVGAGKDIFGPSQGIAVKAADTLAARAKRMAKANTTKLRMTNAEGVIADWTERHPIESITFARTSIAPQLLRLHHRPEAHGMAQSLANVEDSLDDVLQRLTLYSERNPREILWTSQVVAGDMLRHPSIEQMLQELHETQSAVATMTRFVEGIPSMVDAQRDAAFEDIARERQATLDVLQAERAVILAAVTQERIAVMQELKAIYQDARETLEQERAAVLGGLPKTVARSVARSEGTLRALIDHLLLRLVELVGVATLVLALGFWGVRTWRRRHHGSPRRSHAAV